jgi:DNA-binding NarL/FixJ family response regulator
MTTISSDKIRILVVDDHPVVRQGVRSILANHPDIEIVGEADSAVSLFTAIDSNPPDIVLLDIRMPGQNGIEITQRLKRERPNLKVILLTTYDEDEFLVGALRAGADGYLLKSSSHQVLASSIRQVAQGERLLSPALVDKMMRQFQEMAAEKMRADSGLSDQELQVLKMIAAGSTNKEIADKLYWSEVTVKRKTQDIFEKLDVANRAQAVAEATKRGLL